MTIEFRQKMEKLLESDLKRFLLMEAFIENAEKYINSNRNLNYIILKLPGMKKIISQQRDASVLKPYPNDYTDVSTQNSTEHSLDSSFEEKSCHPSQADRMEEDVFKPVKCCEMEDQAQGHEKLTKIAYYKRAVDWLGRKYRKFRVKIDTFYLGVSYVIRYLSLGVDLKHQPELLGAVCLLLAAKINEVHFPSIKSVLGAVDFFTTKKQLLQLQEEILALFGFEVGLQKNSYSILNQFFSTETEQKRKNAQKLLYLSICNPQTLQFGETYLTLSIVYLLKPDALKDTLGINRDRMKKIAFIVYNMYREKKAQLANKENCGC